MTQQEIADRFGVHQSTISLLLRDPHTKRISTRKRQEILAFLREMNYINANYTHQTRNIVLAVGAYVERHSHFFHEAIRGIERIAEKNKYNVFVETIHGGLLNVVRERKVDGIIFASASSIPESCDAVTGPLPVVMLDCRQKVPTQDTVMFDNILAMEMLLEKIHEKGVSDIAFLYGVPPQYRKGGFIANIEERLEGYRQTMRRLAPERESTWNGEVLISERSVRQTQQRIALRLSQWFSKKPHPKAIVCINTFYASLVRKWLQENELPQTRGCLVAGIRFHPDDVALNGDIDVMVYQDLEQMGEIAAELLMLKLRREWSAPAVVRCIPKLVTEGTPDKP